MRPFKPMAGGPWGGRLVVAHNVGQPLLKSSAPRDEVLSMIVSPSTSDVPAVRQGSCGPHAMVLEEAQPAPSFAFICVSTRLAN